jgi:hypothetical protein
MRLIGFILSACIALAVLRVALAAILVVVLLTIVVSFVVKPAETIGLFGFFLLAFLLQHHAIATLAAFVALCAIGAIAKRFDR